MAEAEGEAAEAPPPPMPAVQLPLSTTAEHPGTLLMMMQVKKKESPKILKSSDVSFDSLQNSRSRWQQ
jgi:hypothetical protein